MTILTSLLVLLALLIASAVKHVPAGQVYSLYRRGKLARLLQPGVPGLLVSRRLAAGARHFFECHGRPPRPKGTMEQRRSILNQKLSVERVSINFVPRDSATEVIVTHERIASAAARTQHESGWIGCLAGLARFAEGL